MGPLHITAAFLAACTLSTSEAWNMKPVHSVQARVQSIKPVYNETHKAWVAPYGDSFEARYMATMDTVNGASVEGALMYVQAEGINQDVLPPNCWRKSNLTYIWFMDIEIAQSNFSIAEYGEKTNVYPEYCPFVAMDGGMCTPTQGSDIPPECKQYAGIDGQPNIGACVGGENRIDDERALYKNNIWFSYPNSCFTQGFAGKNDTCRANEPGGLCPYGVKPDGIKCMFAYTILGYINIDDLVGITSMKSNKTNKNYETTMISVSMVVLSSKQRRHFLFGRTRKMLLQMKSVPMQ